MNEIAAGSLSSGSRKWLHSQAQTMGIDAKTADGMINRVMAMPNPVERQRAYVQNAGGDAPEGLIREAMALARDYGTVEASSGIEDRLAQRDKHTNAGIPDQPRFAEDRAQAGSVRASIEASLVSSGLVAPKAQSLQEAQSRAMAYSNAVADRLESRMRTEEPASLRDTIEDSYLAADALGAKADAGLGEQTISDVAERADAAASYGRSMVE
jgi:hypothetical protein